MPEQIPSWKTTDGTVFTNYLDALKHELIMYLAKAGDNDVGAKKIAESLTSASVKNLINILTAIDAEMDSPAKFEVHLVSPAQNAA